MDMDHEEFHDIDVNNNKPGHKNHHSETSVSLICSFVKAEQQSGSPLPTFMFTPKEISEICAIETGKKPE